MQSNTHSNQSTHHPIKQEAADGCVLRTAGFEVFCPSVCQSCAASSAAPTNLRQNLSKLSRMCHERPTSQVWWKWVGGGMMLWVTDGARAPSTARLTFIAWMIRG